MSRLLPDRVELEMPEGGEDTTRAFYGNVLGLREIPKPRISNIGGGIWFVLADGKSLHVRSETYAGRGRRTHPAFHVSDLDKLAGKLSKARRPVLWDDALAPRKRFFCEDPFGNRLEFRGRRPVVMRAS